MNEEQAQQDGPWSAEIDSVFSALAGHYPERAMAPQPDRYVKGVGRNSPCPCGSGKKFKACCQRRPL